MIRASLTPEQEDSLRQAAEQEIQQAEERERRKTTLWPSDYRKAMTQLAEMFPTMHGVPGINPWDVDTLIKWMNGPAPTSGSWNAAMFLLGVWNPTTDWKKECGLKTRKGVNGRFDFFRAFGCWDEDHLKAFMIWFNTPFWP